MLRKYENTEFRPEECQQVCLHTDGCEFWRKHGWGCNMYNAEGNF